MKKEKRKLGDPLRFLLACVCGGLGLGIILGVATRRLMFGLYYGLSIGLVAGLFFFILLRQKEENALIRSIGGAKILKFLRRRSTHKLWNALNDAKKMKWVELSHLMDNNSPYWSGIPAGSAKLGEVVFDWGNPMLECQIQTFKFPGQFGTHVDFPAHFVKDAPYAEAFGMKDAVFPLCVVDISEKVKRDPTYCVTAKDIRAYEAAHGEIPDGAFVALRTDWYKNWPDMDAMSGTAPDGSENFPGWSLEAIKYIYETRNAAANGHETLDTDGSAECARNGDLACERYVLASGKMQIELLRNLDQLPPAGAVLFASWPNFKGANGLPCRVFAVMEE